MIDVVSIEPFQATKQTIKLATSDGVEHGSIDIRLVFRPEVRQAGKPLVFAID